MSQWGLWITGACVGGAVGGISWVVLQKLQRQNLPAVQVNQGSMRRGEMRRKALENSPLFRLLLPVIQSLAGFLGRLETRGVQNYLRPPYQQAGYPGGLDDEELVAVGFLVGLGFAAFSALAGQVFMGGAGLVLAVPGIVLGLLALSAQLKNLAGDREIQILKALPYMLDLLVLMLRSGTSLRLALERVAADYRDHPLGVELGQVLAEMEVGSSRTDAFERMAERLRIQDITSLADCVVQSEELGWPLAETLERLADRMAAERMLRAQSTAGKAGVWVMLPSTMVLAASVLLLFGPILVRLMRNGMVLG